MEKITGPGDTECYRISHRSGAAVVIARHGGHIISWKTADGTERFYMSPTAEFSAEKAIRGGVPIIFPQFSDHGPFGRHGFARKSDWTPDLDAGGIRLKSSDATRADWPFDFELSVRVQLTGKTLEIEWAVTNTGSESFAFQAALHSYFAVDDVCEISVDGLDGLDFENEVTKQTEAAAPAGGIKFGSEIDRTYLNAGNRAVSLSGENQLLRIESENFPAVVVWNPGPDHGIGDLPETGWQNFVCIESAQTQNGEALNAGETWRGSQKIEATI